MYMHEWNQNFIIALSFVLYMSPKITEFEVYNTKEHWFYENFGLLSKCPWNPWLLATTEVSIKILFKWPQI